MLRQHQSHKNVAKSRVAVFEDYKQLASSGKNQDSVRGVLYHPYHTPGVLIKETQTETQQTKQQQGFEQ